MGYQGGNKNGGVNWNYFDKFDAISDKYLSIRGEGETMATQLVTAVSKLIYKWYNDGDVFDNTHYLDGWCNDLSSYANWIYEHIPRARYTLDEITEIDNHADYECLLRKLADLCLTDQLLENLDRFKKTGSIYDCKGKFRFEEYDDEEDDYEWEDDEEDE